MFLRLTSLVCLAVFSLTQVCFAGVIGNDTLAVKAAATRLEQEEGAVKDKIRELYEAIPDQQSITVPEEVFEEELLRVANYVYKMLPADGKLSRVEILDKIVDHNMCYWYRVKRKLLPTFVFSPDVYPTYPGRAPRLIAITSGEKFVISTTVHSDVVNIEDVLGKGGCRWHQVGVTPDPELEGTKLTDFEKKLATMLPENVRLSEAMGDKNPYWDVFFDGGKTVFLAEKDVDKEEVIRNWVASSISAGVLLNTYIAGPDMDMAEEEMEWIVDEADRVGRDLKFEPRILATTSRNTKKGSFSHEPWMVTSIGVVETMLTALRDEKLLEHFKIDNIDEEGNISIVIQGFGDVGSGVIRYLYEYYPELLASGKIKIVGASNENGGIYNKNGLDVEKLLGAKHRYGKACRLGRVYINQFKGKAEFYDDPGEILFKGATVVIPAAGPDVFTDKSQVERMKSKGTKMVVEGANNSVSFGIEKVFHELGVVFIPGPAANGGGIYASTEEFFHVLLEGEETIIHHVDDRRIHVQDGIADLAISNTRWLIGEFGRADYKKSIYEIHARVVEEIKKKKNDLLASPTSEMERRANLDYSRRIPYRIARIIAASEIARESVVYKYADIERLLAALDLPGTTPHNITSQRVAAYILGKLRYGPATEKLVRILNDNTKDPDVRKNAAEALGNICDPATLEVLKRNVDDLNPHVSVWSDWALAKVEAGNNVRPDEPDLIHAGGADRDA